MRLVGLGGLDGGAISYASVIRKLAVGDNI